MTFKKGRIPWNKGKKTGQITWITGKHHSEEARKRMSEKHKGQVAWNKGKHHSEEHIKHLSEAQQKRFSVSSSWNKGLRGVMKPNKNSFKKGQTPWNKGKKGVYSEEVKRKMNESRKIAWTNPELRKRASEITKKIMANPEVRKNLSEKHKGSKGYWLGKQRDEETVRKMVELRLKEGTYRTGDKSFFWQGGISFEPYSQEWKDSLKSKIRERDNYTCQICGKEEKELRKKLSIHHIDYNKKNCNPENLIGLCVKCHSNTTINREKWIEYFRQRKLNNKV